ncbi:MAG: polyprenyl synthetase family protein [Dehalococcoidia bacterium]|jgi:geranylgeranyl pyrophosphate synthase|nr:polyprenyl synthetase family protein [Dehalococcoidia bacterium]MDW8009203.1 polyprenyl synthetase family protein [Chloroflexota bacterium]
MVASRLYGPVQQDLALVEEVIGSLRQVDYQPLAQMLELVLSTSGKRLRPALVLLAGTFGHYRLDLLVPLAASVELLHTATLVHDDVIDSADTRRGRPTVNSVFHNSTCVMLGDYMFAHAAELVARTGNIRVIRLFAHTLMVMARGEITQDMSAYDSRQDVQEYLHRIAGKTASLFATACEGGAIVAEEPEEWIQALREYGYNLGMAFQIVDDILDFTGDEAEMGKPVGSDLMQGTLTLPSLLLMQRYPADNPVQRFFRERTEDHLQQAVLMVRESDIPAESYAMANQFCRRALEALSPLPATEARRTLEELAQYILERRS